MPQSTTALSSEDTLSSSMSAKLFLPLLFNEFCLRPDMLGFIRYLSDAVGTTGRAFLNRDGCAEDISSLCVKVIEPIAQRFEVLASTGLIPGALCTVLKVLCGTTDSTAGDKSIHILSLVDCLAPRIVQWLYRHSTERHLVHSEDRSVTLVMKDEGCLSLGEQTVLIGVTQDLLKMCLVNGFKSADTAFQSPGNISCVLRICVYFVYFLIVGSLCFSTLIFFSSYFFLQLCAEAEAMASFTECDDLQQNLSLSHHAALARSKWMIAK